MRGRPEGGGGGEESREKKARMERAELNKLTRIRAHACSADG